MDAQGTPVGNKDVFCEGKLLEAVQCAHIYDDSKTFVDRPLKSEPAVVLKAFESLSDHSSSNVKQFVEQWTDSVHSDVVASPPEDWVTSPAFINDIQDPAMKTWATYLNGLWRDFGKKVHSSVSEHPGRHSLLPLPHPYIAPGADSRFSEIYYWDSYWILQGILLCEMRATAKGMIQNFAHLIDRYGLVPNGGRIYYTCRSQPPLLTQMVDLYSRATGDKDTDFLHELLPRLVKEHEFWLINRSVKVGVHTLARYAADTTGPRPEMYGEDVTTAQAAPHRSCTEVYSDLASAAESGWDFSTRWLAHSGTTAGQLSSIRTRRIVPVDLNAILCQNEKSLARLFTIVGDTSTADRFHRMADARQEALDSVLWNETVGLWQDWDLDTETHLGGFYASSLYPLYWGCDQGDSARSQLVLSRMQTLGVLQHPGGIPTSLEDSGQQWDFPNAWAPLQWFPVLGWHNSPDQSLRDAARSIARTWITTTYTAWKKHGVMYEKYNCKKVGQPGGGGEYTNQSGFGWTNGVVLHFLSLYPDIEPNDSAHN